MVALGGLAFSYERGTPVPGSQLGAVSRSLLPQRLQPAVRTVGGLGFRVQAWVLGLRFKVERWKAPFPQALQEPLLPHPAPARAPRSFIRPAYTRSYCKRPTVVYQTGKY